MVGVIHCEEGIRQVRKVEREVLEAKGGLHCEEDWNFRLQREGALGQLVFRNVVFELSYLF